MATTSQRKVRRKVRRTVPRRPLLVELLQTVASAAIESPSADQALHSCLARLCELTHWRAGHVWLTEAEEARLTSSGIWREDPAWDLDGFRKTSELLTLMPGEDLPGRALELHRPQWARDLCTDRSGPRAAAAGGAGVHAACAFPAWVGDRVVAVVELYAREPAEPVAASLRAIGQVGGLWGKIVERRLLEAPLSDRASLAHALLASAPDCIIAVDREGRVIHLNPRAEALFGYTRSEVLGRDFADLVPEASRAVYGRGLARANPGGGTPPGRSVDVTAVRKDGSEFCAELFACSTRVDGENLIAVYVTDITHRKDLEQRLRYEALHDDLTELPNRKLFLDRMEHALARSGRHHDPHSVIFVDLDDFKHVNDTLGHASGDELLVEVGRRLRGRLRPGDTVARLGGDEFAVLLEDTDSDGAARVARRMIRGLEAPLSLKKSEVHVHASIGVATGSSGRTAAEDLLKQADEAMYDVKGKGKEGIAVAEAADD